MSLITDAVIMAHYVRPQVAEHFTTPIPTDTQRGQSFRKIDTESAGGNKVFCTDLYAAAFNYFGVDDLEEWFCGLPWHQVDYAVLTACGENRDLVTITRFDGQTVITRSELVDVYTDTHRLVTEASHG